jgi:hypothetical protein
MLQLLRISAIFILLGAPGYLKAQDDDDDISLGQVARELRTSRPSRGGEVIDNDNLNRLMDEAESQRLDGKPIFSISPSGVFTAVSPDGSCSLSFDARSVTPATDLYITADLPQDEIPKLSGPAVLQDGALEVSVQNGTGWELKEVVVGITAVQTQTLPPEYRFATLETALSAEKLPDATALYHLKGDALPGTTALFRAQTGGEFPLRKDWRWEIIGARGIPPSAHSSGVATAPDQPPASPNSALPTESNGVVAQSNSSATGTMLAGSTPAITPRNLTTH